MNLIWVVVLVMVFNNGHFSNGVSTNTSNRPKVVNIGCMLSFHSEIGKVGKVALEAAVEDVNSDPAVLKGTELRLNMHDINYSGFMAMVEGIIFLARDPQVSKPFVSPFQYILSRTILKSKDT